MDTPILILLLLSTISTASEEVEQFPWVDAPREDSWLGWTEWSECPCSLPARKRIRLCFGHSCIGNSLDWERCPPEAMPECPPVVSAPTRVFLPDGQPFRVFAVARHQQDGELEVSLRWQPLHSSPRAASLTDKEEEEEEEKGFIGIVVEFISSGWVVVAVASLLTCLLLLVCLVFLFRIHGRSRLLRPPPLSATLVSLPEVFPPPSLESLPLQLGEDDPWLEMVREKALVYSTPSLQS